MHAMCEDYRASASIDLNHDRADRLTIKKLRMPLRVLWAEHGLVNKCCEPLDDWRKVAEEVSGKTLACGHYIPEELPVELLEEVKKFFR